MHTAMFGAGCFWGVEEAFRILEGVASTEVGFSGGTSENPTYEEVCSFDTHHAEVVRVIFDDEKISYTELLEVFWKNHNPTQKNRQGPDVGSQYRSVVFYYDEQQKNDAERSKQALEQSKKYSAPIATVIEQAGMFYKAEEYHQQYLAKRGKKGCRI